MRIVLNFLERSAEDDVEHGQGGRCRHDRPSRPRRTGAARVGHLLEFLALDAGRLQQEALRSTGGDGLFYCFAVK